MLCRERYWIGKLQQVLNAADFRFGSYSNLDNQTIVDARKPLCVVIDWIRQLAVSLEHDCPLQPSFLSHVMVIANIAFTFDRNDAAVYLYRPKFIHSDNCPEQYFRLPHGENCLKEFLVALHENCPSSIVNGILFIRSVANSELCIIIHHKFYLQPSDGSQDSCRDRHFLQLHRTHMQFFDRIPEVSARRQSTRGNAASQLVESYSGHFPVCGERNDSFRVAFTVAGRTVEDAAL